MRMCGRGAGRGAGRGVAPAQSAALAGFPLLPGEEAAGCACGCGFSVGIGYLGDSKFFLQVGEVHAGRRTQCKEQRVETHVFCLLGHCAQQPGGRSGPAHFLTNSRFTPAFTVCSSEAEPSALA